MSDNEYPLGRIFIPDTRDLSYPLHAAMPRAVRRVPRRYYRTGPILDQNRMACPHCLDRHPYCCRQGFCVGCAWKQWWASAPRMTAHEMTAIAIYHRAQANDEWDGGPESYSGSSVRGGAGALQELGIIQSYHWAYTVDDILDWLLGDCGTVVLGTNWYSTMYEPDEKGFIRPGNGYLRGGHAYLAVGASEPEERVRIVNSWGADWGDNGRAWISFVDLERLLREEGEACGAVEVKGGE